MTDMPPVGNGATRAFVAAAGERSGVSFDTCDREPIHVPSLIQPHGAILGIDPASGNILYASDNVADHLPLAAGWQQGMTLADVVGGVIAARVLEAAVAGPGDVVRHVSIVLPARPEEGRPLDLQGIAHRHGDMVILEVAPAPASASRDWMQAFTDALDTFRVAGDFDDLVRRIAASIRSLTGFDRAMVYRFEEDWCGRVISDDHAPHMESFLDFHYPAGDIPAQARRLYLRSLVRYVPDIGYRPVPVRSRTSDGAPPLDMSYSVLRSVSPMHVQYVKNMGVTSTLSISLIVNGQLWGLVTCHHETPTALPFEMLRACHALSVAFSSVIGSAIALEREKQTASLASLRRRIVDAFALPQLPVASVVAQCETWLLKLGSASAGLFWLGHAVHPFGTWPAGAPMEALVAEARRRLQACGGRAFFTDRLASILHEDEVGPLDASGLAALSLGPEAVNGLALVRPEWRREVTWGGDPNHAKEPVRDFQGNWVPSPRTSFARWSIEVGGGSRPWTDVDRSAIEGLVALRPILCVGDAVARPVVGDGQFRALATLHADAYWQTDPDGVIAVLSRPLAFGGGGVEGRTFGGLFAEASDPGALERLEEAIAAARPFRGVSVTCVHPDGGEVFEYEFDGEPMRDAGGNVTGMHGTIRDISVRQRNERSLRAAKEAAERASAAKTSFLASMSHEIRTPLNALIGLASLVADEHDEDYRRALIERLSVAGTALLDVVNDVLDVAKIEAGELDLENEEFRLGELLRQVNDLLAAQAQGKGIELQFANPAADVPEAYVGDVKRLRQVLVNLVGNAIRFTPGGFVRVETSVAPADRKDRVRLVFEVIDSGVGIEPEFIPRLFTPFFQAAPGPTRRSGGAGLGLTIVRRLVTLMGGAVSVRSRRGEGATFRVEVELPPLPAGRGAADGAAVGIGSGGAAHGAKRLEGVRVLIVDDDEANLLVLRRWLEREGAVVCTCADGREAVAWLAASGTGVDIVLMDVQMPVMDGNMAVTLLRGIDRFRSLPILALSAGALESEREAALMAGMTGYLTKPFDPNTVICGILKHVRRS